MFSRWLKLAAIGYGMIAAAGPIGTAAAGDAGSDSVEAPRPAGTNPVPTAEDVAGWIEALSSESYAERKAATHKLFEAGRVAIAPIKLAADSDDLETPGRCIRILKRLAESSDPPTKRAAVDALRDLVRSRHTYVTREATLALLEPAPIPDRQVRLAGRFAQLRGVPVQVGGAVRRSLVRELKVEDEGRQVSIRYQSGTTREIRVRIAETVNGQLHTQEFKAANTTALREQSATAADLYTKHLRDLLKQPVQVIAENQRILLPAAIPQRAIPVRVGNPVRRSLVRELDVEDAGRKINIRYQTGHAREIRVRITETVNGREQTQEFKSEDTTGLRQRSEEAAELFAKYARDLLRQPVELVAGEQAALQPFVVPRPAMQIRVQANQNGERSVQFQQNGRQIQITETGGRDIVVRITSAANGAHQTVEYRARDLDELKERHPPEVAEVYEKYARGLGIRVVTGRAVPLQTVYGKRGRLEVPLRPAAPKSVESVDPAAATPAATPAP